MKDYSSLGTSSQDEEVFQITTESSSGEEEEPKTPMDLFPQYNLANSKEYLDCYDDDASQRRSYFGGDGASRSSWVWFFLRYPLLLFIVSCISLDLSIYFITRYLVLFYEELFIWNGQAKALRKRLEDSTSFIQYSSEAKKLDACLGIQEWKEKPTVGLYDEKLILKITRRLSRFKSDAQSGTSQAIRLEAINEMIKILKHGACKSNNGNVENEALYSHSYHGTKHIVDEYYAEIAKSLNFIADSNDVCDSVKSDFFKLSSRTFGRSSLCLSGGASLGYYHIGVAKALFENSLLPKVITGTSAGSLIGALICCRTDEELVKEVFTPDVYKLLNACEGAFFDWENLKRLFKTGALFDFDIWYKKICMQITMGDLTFLEAYKRTGRILNVTVVPDEQFSNSKCLNYITAPDVVIATAVVASSAIPSILLPVTLLEKQKDGSVVPFLGSGSKWRDGSLRTDIPEKELHQLFDINYTIVSQTNPHVLVFFYERMGSAGSPVAHKKGKGWRGGFIGSSITQHFKLDMLKWLSLLRDLALVPRYQGTDFSDVFTQNFTGSVTITPPALFRDYLEIMSDPTREKMERLFKGAEKATFAKMSMIRHRMGLEKTLNGCRKRAIKSDLTVKGVVLEAPNAARRRRKRKY